VNLGLRPIINTDVIITRLRKGEFGLLLSFMDGKPAGVMEFMPPAERKALYRQQQVISENDKFTMFEPIKCWVPQDTVICRMEVKC
jgi:DNA ligase 1